MREDINETIEELKKLIHRLEEKQEMEIELTIKKLIHRLEEKQEMEIELTNDQQRRLSDVLRETRASETQTEVYRAISNWLRVYKTNPGHWKTVIEATKTLPLPMRQSTFLLGYLTHAFIEKMDEESK